MKTNIKGLKIRIELIKTTDEEMKGRRFFIDGKEIYFKDVNNKDFREYYKSVEGLKRNNHPAYIFQKYLKDRNINFKTTEELVELWSSHKIDYNEELNKKLQA